MGDAVGMRDLLRIDEVPQLIFAPTPQLRRSLHPFPLLFTHRRRRRRVLLGPVFVIARVGVEAAPLERRRVDARVVHDTLTCVVRHTPTTHKKKKVGPVRRSLLTASS